MPLPPRIPLARAQAIAARIIERIGPFCERIEIAGSIRRERPDVGDIDIVALANDRPAIESTIRERAHILKCGPEMILANLRDGTQLDLWFARRDLITPDLLAPRTLPANFGSVLLCRTGSKAHNIGIVEQAKRQGLRWHPHDGLFRDQEPIAATEETDILTALGLPWIEPTRREQFSRFTK
jgi:DNA polymerase (family 10)